MDDTNQILDLAAKLIAVIIPLASIIYFLIKRDGAAKLLKENVVSDALRKNKRLQDKSKNVSKIMAQSGILNVDTCRFVSNGAENVNIEKLNQLFISHAVLIGEMDGPCALQSVGELSLPPAQAMAAQSFRSRKGLNESHGLVAMRDVMQDFDFRALSYWDSDYADVSALRDCGAKPPILSSGGIICCSNENKVILHRRSPNAGTYPHARHILGGSFKPRTTNILNDDDDLDYTARRELNEETGNALGSNSFDLSKAMRLSSVELSSGFIQITHLGVDISSQHLQALKSTPEGGIDILTFQELSQALKKGKWVPSGQLLLLYWLSKGAPCGDGVCAFEDKDACIYLYQDIISEPDLLLNSWSSLYSQNMIDDKLK